MTYQCPLCKARGKTWDGDDPTCGFHSDGTFNPDNWNCCTLGMLRQYAETEDKVTYLKDDQRYSVLVTDIPDDGPMSVLALYWYKSRGNTEKVVVLSKDNRTLLEHCLIVLSTHVGVNEYTQEAEKLLLEAK